MMTDLYDGLKERLRTFSEWPSRDKYGRAILVPASAEDALSWADLLLVTGTTLVNSTIEPFLGNKPVLFYGTTIAGAAHFMG